MLSLSISEKVLSPVKKPDENKAGASRGGPGTPLGHWDRKAPCGWGALKGDPKGKKKPAGFLGPNRSGPSA